MRYGRGLTLIEVLASTALLAMMAAACVPLLRQSMRAAREPEHPIELLELAQIASGFLADPSALKLGQERGSREMPWPDHPERPPIAFERLTSEDVGANHAWVTFTCAGLTVSRWVPVEQPGEEPAG